MGIMRDTVERVKKISSKVEEEISPLRELCIVINNEGSLLRGLTDYIAVEISTQLMSQCKAAFALKSE